MIFKLMVIRLNSLCIAGLNIPSMQAVGWEGVFGFSILSVLLVIFYWVPAPAHFGNNPRGTVEDAIDGLIQIGTFHRLQFPICLLHFRTEFRFSHIVMYF